MTNEEKEHDPTTTAAETPAPEKDEVIEKELPRAEGEKTTEEEAKKPGVEGSRINQEFASMIARFAYLSPVAPGVSQTDPASLAQGYVGFVVEGLNFLDWHECLDVFEDLSKKTRFWIGIGVIGIGLILYPAPILGALKKKKPLEKKGSAEKKEPEERGQENGG